jgi:hypothetical protein
MRHYYQQQKQFSIVRRGLPPEVLTRTSKLERTENRAMAGPGRPKTGGRQKGTRNKVNQLATKRLEEMAINGKDPVTFFSQILQDQNAPYQERKDAAKELLPYYHPKLASIEARTGGQTHEDRLEELRRLCEDD